MTPPPDGGASTAGPRAPRRPAVLRGRVLAVAAAAAVVAGIGTAVVNSGPEAPGPGGDCGSYPTPPLTRTVAFTGRGSSPGAAGIGDTYFPSAGNGGYDVTDYDIHLCYAPARREIAGSTSIVATATADLTSFNLDFTGLQVWSASVDGTPVAWEHAGGELTLVPDVALKPGDTFTAVIAYGGRPQPVSEHGLGESGFLTSAGGAVAIGEPEVAAYWFPVNDHPRDKATYTISIVVPDGTAALSNGVLTLRGPADPPGYTIWTWRVNSPMAPYLATVVIGDYRVTEDVHDGLPVVLAVHTSLPEAVDDDLARTPELLDWLETQFGPYPFDAVGGIVVADPRVGFALENQTRPVYGPVFFGGGDASWVLVHELAHQWFGDSVSIHDWSDIWLNEGFATYAEWLWAEHQGGRTAQLTFDRIYDAADEPLWRVPPADVGTAHLFQAPGSEYTRGAMALHALRVTVGDDAFFRILREWAARHKDGVASTAEFVALAEEVSAQQLDELFQDWLYGTVRPPRP